MSVINSIPLIAAGDDGYQISRSVRLRSSASAYFNRTPASASNRKTWTWSGWVKRGKLGADQDLFGYYASGINESIRFGSNDTLYRYCVDTSGTVNRVLLNTNAVYRDTSAWYHIMVVQDTTQATNTDRVKIYVNGVQQSVTASVWPALNWDGYFNTVVNHQLFGSSGLYFDGLQTETYFIDGQALTPSSFGETDAVTGVWKPKKYAGTYGTNGFYLPFSDPSSTTSLGYDWSKGYGAGQNLLLYSEQFDNAAWTGGATNCSVTANDISGPTGTVTADRLQAVTSGFSRTYQVVSGASNNTSYTFSVWLKAGNVSNVSIRARDSFSTAQVVQNVTLTSAWQRFTVTVSTGPSGTTSVEGHIFINTNGVSGSSSSGDYIYAWGAQLELGSSATTYTPTTTVPAPNNWTPNNISVTAGATYDSMLDVPTPYADGGNGRGNYAVWSKVDTNSGGTTIWNANISNNDAGSDVQLRSTIAVSSGKWYYEWTFQSAGTGSAYSHMGVATIDSALIAAYLGSTATSWSIWLSNGNKRNNASSVAYGSGVTANDVIMCAFDVDAGKIWWGKNGTWFASGDPAAGSNAAFTNLAGTIAASCTPRDISHVNFGQRPFAYTPPTGFKALNTQNLPDSTIKKGNAYFDALTWTGDGTSPKSRTGYGFQPDLVWAKGRSASHDHALFDAVRGTGAKVLSSNSTSAENDYGLSVVSFDANGFTTQTGSLNHSYANTNGSTYVGWAWKESVSAGFDIVTYTGTGANRTVAHSLGVVPKMIIAKNRGGTSSWAVYHASLGAENAVYLNLTQASAVTTNWNSTAPTSSVFSVGTGGEANPSGGNLVAYLFAEVAGFSKFGSYTGNGSSDGPFVYCGFRPRWIMIKRSDSTSPWLIYDTSRDTYNQTNNLLRVNTSQAETTSGEIDILSNGFKYRGSSTNADYVTNVSGATYIYATFAENPFKNSLAR